jgi:hypothetical protein
MSGVTKKSALSACAAYATSRGRFQTYALRYVWEQALRGNADAAMMVLEAAGMLLPTGSMTADGRAAVRWLLANTAEGGCGLSGVIKWDDGEGRVVMCKKWTAAADKIDRAAAEQNIESILWSAWGKNTVRAARAFDLEAKVVALVKKAAKDAGMTPGEIEAHVKAATAKGLLALKAA